MSHSQLIKEFSSLLTFLPEGWKTGGTHILRRSPAQSMVDSGADIAKVSRYLSHCDLAITTEHYARYMAEMLNKAVQEAMPELYCDQLIPMIQVPVYVDTAAQASTSRKMRATAMYVDSIRPHLPEIAKAPLLARIAEYA